MTSSFYPLDCKLHGNQGLYHCSLGAQLTVLFPENQASNKYVLSELVNKLQKQNTNAAQIFIAIQNEKGKEKVRSVMKKTWNEFPQN